MGSVAPTLTINEPSFVKCIPIRLMIKTASRSMYQGLSTCINDIPGHQVFVNDAGNVILGCTYIPCYYPHMTSLV